MGKSPGVLLLALKTNKNGHPGDYWYSLGLVPHQPPPPDPRKMLATYATDIFVYVRCLGLSRGKSYQTQILRSKSHQNPLLVVRIGGGFPSFFIQAFPGNKKALLTQGTKDPECDEIK